MQNDKKKKLDIKIVFKTYSKRLKINLKLGFQFYKTLVISF